MDAIRARAIIEILGSPAEHINESLHNFVEKIKKDKYKIIREDYAEPIPQGTMFSCFVELDAEFQTLGDVMNFCMDAMPSSIEIMEPDTLITPISHVNASLNDLQTRLHTVDMELKRLKATTELIDQNAVALFRNFIMHVIEPEHTSTKQEPRNLENLSKIVGVPSKHMQSFLNRMIEDHLIEEHEGTYSIAAKIEP